MHDATKHYKECVFTSVNNEHLLAVLKNAWSITESVESRTSLGTHWGFLFETPGSYFYLERNWES